jgi:hypothetical protein
MVVGFSLTDQQAPLETTNDPPSFVTFPPHIAVEYNTPLTAAVKTSGGNAGLSAFLQEKDIITIRQSRDILIKFFIVNIYPKV